MYEITFENKNGDRLQFGAGTPYTIKEFQGLNPPKATINTSEAAFVDGSIFNSSKLQSRNVNVAFYIESDAEKSRLDVYKVLKSKQYVKLNFNSTYLDTFIEGYVESINITYFAKKQVCTVSILCPFPYLKSAKTIEDKLSGIIPKFHFPFPTESPMIFGMEDMYTSVYVENNGTAETGLTFIMRAKKACTNPTIYNYVTNEFMKINLEFVQGDEVTITTGQGNKTITLLREGVKSNIFNLLDKDSTWLELPTEGATFVYEVETGSVANLVVTIEHNDLYEGV